jgi:hypothetical protein
MVNVRSGVKSFSCAGVAKAAVLLVIPTNCCGVPVKLATKLHVQLDILGRRCSSVVPVQSIDDMCQTAVILLYNLQGMYATDILLFTTRRASGNEVQMHSIMVPHHATLADAPSR